MTPGRRTVSFGSFDEIMPDVEELLKGHTTVGNWSLAQICRHVASVLRRVVDMPATTPQDPSLWVGEEQKRQVLESGMLPEGIQGPPAVMPTEAVGCRRRQRGCGRRSRTTRIPPDRSSRIASSGRSPRRSGIGCSSFTAHITLASSFRLVCSQTLKVAIAVEDRRDVTEGPVCNRWPYGFR